MIGKSWGSTSVFSIRKQPWKSPPYYGGTTVMLHQNARFLQYGWSSFSPQPSMAFSLMMSSIWLAYSTYSHRWVRFSLSPHSQGTSQNRRRSTPAASERERVRQRQNSISGVKSAPRDRPRWERSREKNAFKLKLGNAVRSLTMIIHTEDPTNKMTKSGVMDGKCICKCK